ncbi:MAG: SDR family oxidoreductase [Candidatus Lokiarchaeota archaeon]|nr:SDR family oxidoreductase [Candidatus Lokiarchaeota archaeon]
MKILVTGGNGFLGTNIVHALLENIAGYDVRAFGLPNHPTKYIQNDRVEIVFGNVLNPSDVDRAVKGVEYVIHSAGDTSFWQKNFKIQRQVNTEGVRNVMESALKHGVKKVIHTSTIDTIGINPGGLTDETWNEFTYQGTGNVYAESKRKGEQIALSYVDKGLDVVVLNPGSMIGPYDHTLQYGRLFGELKYGKVPGIPSGGVSWAHVGEVAKAHVSALKNGRKGERYICAGENVSYKEVFTEIAKIVGSKPPKIVFPKWILVLYGGFCEFISLFTKKPPEINPGHARYMSMFPRMNSSKAQKELGYRIIPVHQMIEDAYRWYVENGFLEIE